MSLPQTKVLQIEPQISSRLMWMRLLLLGIVLAAFGRCLGNDFVDWDDGKLIYNNPNVIDSSWSSMGHAWVPSNPNNIKMYNPLVYSTWWVLARAAELQYPDILGGRLNPIVYHGANLLVHWLSACIVFEILRRLGMGDWPAVAGAVVFAVHPLQTEAVVWATGMKDLMCGFFMLVAIWRYMVATESTGSARRNNYLLASACTVLAMLAKPSAVVLPLIVAAIDLLWYRRALLGIVLRTAPWLVLAVVATLIATSIQPTYQVTHVPIWERPLIAADSLAFYMDKLVLPIRLSFDYSRNPAAVMHDPELHHPLYWTWIFPLALALLIWRSGRRELYIAGAIFVLCVLPVLGLTPFVFQGFSTVADRYVYVSMLGVAIAVAWALGKYGNRTAWATLVAAGIVMITLSFLQTGIWQDSDTLYEHGLALSPKAETHFLILGQYKDHMAAAAGRRADLDHRSGDYAQEQKEREDQHRWAAQGIDAYSMAVKLNPLDEAMYDYLGFDLAKEGRLTEAIEVVKQRIAVQPQLLPSVRSKPGVLEATLGMLYMRTGQYAPAAEQFQKAMNVAPDADTQAMLTLAQQKMAATTRGISN